METSSKKILLVEDEPLLSELLKKRLEDNGMVVVVARDGQEALDALQTDQPDLILLDIILPKVSGFELMEKIQENPLVNEVPIIIISNLGQQGDIEKGQKLGAVGYFVKAQLSVDDLVQKVKGYILGVESEI